MKTKKNNHVSMLLSAMFIGIGLVLPFLTGQIQQIGNMLLPMHLPVMLCGLICGWQYGLVVGAVLPIMRSFFFAMPVLYPSAVSMSFELSTYGFVIGLLFSRAKWKCVKSLVRCLLISMVAGRIVWGVVMTVLMGFTSEHFTFYAFLTGAFINALPGIILQLLLIPSVMLFLDKTHIHKFNSHKSNGYENISIR